VSIDAHCHFPVFDNEYDKTAIDCRYVDIYLSGRHELHWSSRPSEQREREPGPPDKAFGRESRLWIPARALRARHPKLYAELQSYFRQDPVEYSAELVYGC